jgi:protein-S-isoprenylcysteine O-methyltransferase Ste14
VKRGAAAGGSALFGGPYRIVPKPMYVAVLLAIVGQATLRR